jgi:hypothetical protein
LARSMKWEMAVGVSIGQYYTSGSAVGRAGVPVGF